MKTSICIALLLATGFIAYVLGIRTGRGRVVVEERMRVDTVFYERPQPSGFSGKLVSVNVPKLLFAPADTVIRVVTVGNGADSVRIEVEERTVEYRDSTYYARVVGPVIGPMSPRLDFIETYNRTVTQTVRKKPWFAVTAGVGAGYCQHGLQPFIGVSAGIVLWSK